jgi:AcrR family transcriptional regulator
MGDTRQRLLDLARELFNAHGLDRVGVRDIARAAEMSPGNLAYHFPTKDDLVAALVLELHDLDARTTFAELPPELSLATLYRSALAVMRHILRYRFILLSYADAVRASPQLQRQSEALRNKRRRRHDALVEGLIRSGAVDRRAIARNAYLFEQSELISSGWLTAATLQGWTDGEAIVRHYAKVGVALLEPYCTPKGRRELRAILAGKLDAPEEP